ncbi:unnamed protein product [Acanthoscelides obtectus]|uniref:Uncharacterized protein n=1 Tax=Acanthoscelides obtectus TaxID=200917 RepID=A0A9P0M142_ACAOB|nr:unnamed protein product [Acanthoscelides obtectus]CAK1667100.1 hypothetical protein AOBTE_LOCUS25683 [Acanthoscelides obtectus]
MHLFHYVVFEFEHFFRNRIITYLRNHMYKASSTYGCSAFLSICLLPGPQPLVDTNFLIFSWFLLIVLP